MRLFIALPFSSGVTEGLSKVGSELKAAGVSGSFAPRQNLHLTLAFLGEVNDAKPVISAINSVRLSETEIGFGKFSMFGDILVVEMTKNDALARYVCDLRRALDAAGIGYDKKPFRAHVTLVRRTSLPNENFDIKDYFAPLSNAVAKVSDVCLFRTDFIEGKPRYTAIYRKK